MHNGCMFKNEKSSQKVKIICHFSRFEQKKKISKMNYERLLEPYVQLVQDPVYYYVFQATNVVAFICWVLSVAHDNLSQVN